MSKYVTGLTAANVYLTNLYKGSQLLSLPVTTGTDSLCLASTIQTLTNKTISQATLDECQLGPANCLRTNGGNAIYFPTNVGAATVVCTDTVQTLTNKTLSACTLSSCRLGSNNQLITFGGQTLTFPDATGDVVCTTASQTLTNKTLIDPRISTIMNGAAVIVLPSQSQTLIGTSGASMTGQLSNGSGTITIDFDVASIAMGTATPSASYALDIGGRSIRVSGGNAYFETATVLGAAGGLCIKTQDTARTVGTVCGYVLRGAQLPSNAWTVGFYQDFAAGADQIYPSESQIAAVPTLCLGNAYVGINNANPQRALDVIGDVKLSGVLRQDTNTFSLPAASGTLATTTNVESLTNKTLVTPVISSLYQDQARTKLITVPVPDVTPDTFATAETAQTLSNKTLDATNTYIFGIARHDFAAEARPWTLTTTEAKAIYVTITNSNAATTITLPNVTGKMYFVKNATTFDTTAKVASGVGCIIGSGVTRLIMHTGIDYETLSQ